MIFGLVGIQALFARIGTYVLIAGAVFLFGFLKGCQYESAERLELIAKLEKEGTRIMAAREKVTIEVQKVYIEKAAKTRIVTEYVEKEVQRYATANTTMCIDDNWLRLHDAAARNEVPKAGSGVDGKLYSTAAYREGNSGWGFSYNY